MRSLKQIVQSILLISTSAILALASPLMVFADSTPPSSIVTPPPTSPTETPTSNQASPPTTPVTTPSTASTTPAGSSPPPQATPTPEPPKPPTQPLPPPKKTYTYDSTTGRWNTEVWTYDPISGKYQKKPAPLAQSIAPVTGTPIAPVKSDTSSQATVIDDKTTSAIASALDATAISGNASVLHNTKAGDARSGDTTSSATILNNVNSSLSNSANQQAASFTTDVLGDVNGDIMLQPMLLKAMLEAGAKPAGDTSTQLNSSNDTAITNELNLSAKSGDATVAGNTSAGNATSGAANTVANVVNIVNSMIASNQSFVGTVNIYGNLNGDILIAPDFIPQLLASNGAAQYPPVGSASITSSDTQTIVNNIALAAKTGESLVAKNTNAGNATSGNAQTNTVIFNLTGHEIVASNSLLVFVNVLGKWVGVIVDAPAGTTAAALGNGVSSNTIAPDLTISTTNNTLLTNNINLSSLSGDASVLSNTKAGNATSGNATASANIANISNSQIGLSGWFGVLFINVFGNWNGSFGVNTSAGDPLVAKYNDPSGSTKARPARVIEFVPRAPNNPNLAVVQGDAIHSNLGGDSQPNNTAEEVLSATTSAAPDLSNKTSHIPSMSEGFDVRILIGSLVLIGASIFGIRKLL